MNLQDLLYKTMYVDVEKQLINLYPEDRQSVIKGKYKEFYFLLMQINPNCKGASINIKPVGNNEFLWEIVALLDNEEYALDMAPWEDWLGLSVSEDIFDYMSSSEFIARCLWNMSFLGFSFEDRNNRINKLSNIDKDLMCSEFILDVLVELIDTGIFDDDIDIDIDISRGYDKDF